jgi:hypothetical protein
MGRLRDLDRWAEGYSGGRLHRLFAVAATPLVVGSIFLAKAVGELRQGEGVAMALIAAAAIVGGPLLALWLHRRGERGRH